MLDRTRPRRAFRRLAGRCWPTCWAQTDGTDRAHGRAEGARRWTGGSSVWRPSTASRAPPEDGRGLSADEVARYLFRKVVAWGRSSNVFLRNGSRLYLDVGSHPEYATAECDDVRQLVTHDRGGRAHPRGPRGRRPAAARARGPAGHDPPVQEQHRLGGQLLRLPRELPRAPAGRLLPAVRRARAVPDHPPDPHRRGQGAHHAARRGVLPVAARRPHLGGRLQRDHPVPADHQHPRRAARRRRAVPPAARHRRRLVDVRADDDAQGRHHRPGAADDRGRRPDAGPGAGEPDPRDPGDQPRPHGQAPGARWPTAGRSRRSTSRRSTSRGSSDFVEPPRATPTPGASRCWTCGSAGCARCAPATCRSWTASWTGSSSTG